MAQNRKLNLINSLLPNTFYGGSGHLHVLMYAVLADIEKINKEHLYTIAIGYDTPTSCTFTFTTENSDRLLLQIFPDFARIDITFNESRGLLPRTFSTTPPKLGRVWACQINPLLQQLSRTKVDYYAYAVRMQKRNANQTRSSNPSYI